MSTEGDAVLPAASASSRPHHPAHEALLPPWQLAGDTADHKPQDIHRTCNTQYVGSMGFSAYMHKYMYKNGAIFRYTSLCAHNVA